MAVRRLWTVAAPALGALAVFAALAAWSSRDFEGGFLGVSARLSSSSSYASSASGSAAILSSSALASALSADLAFLHFSSYEVDTGVPIGDGLYPFPNLVEMHRMTNLSLTSSFARDSLDEAWSNVYWVVAGTSGEEGHSPRGASVNVRFVVLGEHNVQVKARASSSFVALADADDFGGDDDGLVGTFVVNVKYVRRELRDLSTDDRERYFSAMQALYFTEQTTGAQLYGEDFRNADWFVRMHLYGAAQRDCDHWHDDAGFLTHHVGVTMLLERSLQSVDPTVASHYWDYTIDAQANASFAESPIFGEDWFGAASPLSSDHAINEGIWAYTPVLSNARGFSNVTNSYGLLRSPWNTNPTPYVLRFNEVVGVLRGNNVLPLCDAFQTVIDEGVTVVNNLTMAKVLDELNGALHGTVHIMLGGHWGFDLERVKSSAAFSGSWQSDQLLLGSKFLWRQGLLDCPESCDDEQENCECQCGTRIKSDFNETMSEDAAMIFLADTGVMDVLGHVMTSRSMEALGSYQALVDVLCHVGHPGELFTSAAPQDPIFWSLHGLSERYVQLLRTWNHNGTYALDERWGYKHTETVLSDTRLVCDWTDVDGPRQLPECTPATTCPGHRADDLLPFEWAVSESVPGTQQFYTNQDFYDLMDPWDVRTPYVYDKLSTWPACPGGKLRPTSA